MKKEKICSFYVSDFHLITILLPYINEKITEEKEIITILQNDVSKSIKRYLKNVKNVNVEKEKILDIGWKEIKKMKNLDLENKTVIVSGEEDFVKKINDEIYKEIEDYELLNCYKIDNTEDIAKIASEYSIFLNTSGKTELTENSQNEQKRKKNFGLYNTFAQIEGSESHVAVKRKQTKNKGNRIKEPSSCIHKSDPGFCMD